MKKFTLSRTVLLLFTITTLSITAIGFTHKFGLDYYEFYLNDRLLYKQHVNHPITQRILQLDKAKAADHLQITYTHCMNKGVGTARSLSVKNETGKILHQWSFADGSNAKMSIPAKDLLQLAKKNAGHELKLYYSAKELGKAEMLAVVRFK